MPNSTTGFVTNDTWYEDYERSGVICLSVAALLSITAIVCQTAMAWKIPRTYKTHLFEYLACLLLGNLIQSVGTTMNLKWVTQNGVSNGTYCYAQGAIKQAGNIATALWSFMISLHLFNILFMRSNVSKLGLWLTVLGGWACIALVVFIGPAAIEKPEKGPYFGVSGEWCWITSEYPEEQIYLEYFLEFVSAVLSFLLYCIVLLRVRGNLVHNQGKWRLRFISRSESWRLGFARDLIDSAMMKLAQRLVWFPILYTVILIPITITRLSEFMGHEIPFGGITFAAVVYNLSGFFNVLLVIITSRYFPDIATLPEFNTPRNNKGLSVVFGKTGVTPFTLQHSDTAASYETFRRERDASIRAQASTAFILPGSQPRSNPPSRQPSIASIDSVHTYASSAALIGK